MTAWPEPAGGWKPASKIGNPIGPSELAQQIRAMNERIAARRAAAPSGRPVPIYAPRWADRVVDIGEELLGIHKDTANVYPLRYEDLSPEDHAVVVGRRVLAAGGSTAEAARLIRALVLPPPARARLLRRLEQEDRR